MGVSRPGSLAGLHADRPAAGDLPAGTLWLSTDQDGGTAYRTDESTWTQVAAGVSAASSSPLTTKGDLYTHDGSADARLAVGATGKWLKANSAQTTGLEWADPPGSYAETIGDGAATSFTVTHSLGTEDVHVQVWDVSGADPVLANGDPSSVTATDTNTVTVAFGSAPTTDQYRVVVLASGSGGSDGLLARVDHGATAATTTVSTSSTSYSDVDATNLAITFEAPASGSVVVTLEAVCDAGSSEVSQAYQWNLREGSSNVANTGRAVHRSTTTRSVRVSASINVDGLTPGTSYTYKWGHRMSTSSQTGRIIYGTQTDLDWGPASMKVEAA